MDVIQKLGEVSVCGREVRFGGLTCAVSCEFQSAPTNDLVRSEIISDDDFEAWFEGKNWTVRYFWKDGTPPILSNKVAVYDSTLEGEKRIAFERELERWIEERILVPWVGEVDGLIPSMGVEQETKKKVRPVLDFSKELNEFVASHIGGDVIDICNGRLREWRQIEGGCEIVDLKSANLQICVSPELWKYQLVKFKGKVYASTRLGFGLNSALKIMSKILKAVLAKKPGVSQATSSYIAY
ncbi:Pol polyprotein [Elysia marginata]|uniref:Pol polyprotein n=1 Tax=Elysia marginata TaxID=1093978 RepID=A0AAV4HTM8_9GAST|nr:Pol polyprotein [Elysia marginata]